MSKRAGSWQQEHLPNSYVIAWRQTDPTAVSRTSGMVKLMDASKNVIGMCGGWGYGEDEDPQGYYLEESKAEYRELAERHARGEFPYDTIPSHADSLGCRVEERENLEYIAAVNQPEEE